MVNKLKAEAVELIDAA
ncbi:hypothetical protein AYI70_g5000, partial [Smittium culicis]